MYRIIIPSIGAGRAWRDAARGFLASDIPPEQITWGNADTPADLFGMTQRMPSGADTRVPRSFVALANSVVWHSDPQRFARLYEFLWRLRESPHLMKDRGDAKLAHLRRLEKSVHRCQHKMKAFVRFREVGERNAVRRSFAAWFEPTHHTVEPTAEFFVRRFGDMDWRILTPDVSAIFVDGKLSLAKGQKKPVLPEDANEQLWVTYFRNIFNPARLKIKAMKSEMPKKYWKNMPEADAIPDLIERAPARACAMAEAAPTLPPPRVTKVQAQASQLRSAWDGPTDDLTSSISACTRCPLYRDATQAVAGEGSEDADLMIVGEQPGEMEDLAGRPFIGPAGRLFDQLAERTGLNRQSAYLTNAVKHFKFQPKGKRRLHQRPNTSEISHCRWWLNAELTRVKPRLVLAMGATATEALTGNGDRLQSRRGQIEYSITGYPVLITLHPSYLLRLRGAARIEATENYEGDLRQAVSWPISKTGVGAN